MSTSASIANFYVDIDGKEQPIVYKAADLVNRLAPVGYHWEMDHRLWILDRDLVLAVSDSDDYSSDVERAERYKQWRKEWLSYKPPIVDAYICVKD